MSEGERLDLVTGFSKLTKHEKLNWIVSQLDLRPGDEFRQVVEHFWLENPEKQALFDDFIENNLTNFLMPYGVAPNFKINDKLYCVPMVTEESSVVAAAAKAAKFWNSRGGFKAQVINQEKIGQVHFLYTEAKHKLMGLFPFLKTQLLDGVKDLTFNMQARGGGIKDLELIDKSNEIENYFQLKATFETCNAMGANFINTVLEKFAYILTQNVKVEVIMSILSNYTPNCVVKTWVECPISMLEDHQIDMGPKQFAQKFKLACDITKVDPHRAVTHNKGIFNGIDAVVMATGNDFRAVEACGHAYAARNGKYQGLTEVIIDNDQFIYSLEIPLAVGTVGGLTSLHPLAEASFNLLGRPDAPDLMKIISAVGLAQNFSAVKSLITSGIQRGHMKMHLLNILRTLGATEKEVTQAKNYFKYKSISYNDVYEFINSNRKLQ